MPCGQYCYERNWQCQGGRLRQLTHVQNKPNTTRDYGSEGARENSIRRRVMSVKTNSGQSVANYGPLFGEKTKPSLMNNCGFCGDRARLYTNVNIYTNSSGSSGINIFWNKIAAGSKSTASLLECDQPGTIKNNTINNVNRLCYNGGLVGGAPCSLGGKNWLNYRRFQPRGAKS